MNDENQMSPNDDARLLDLLADGELDGHERRELLVRLDAEPDGWRRCALAFLEAQAWRHGLQAISHEPAPTGVTEALAAAAVGRPQRAPSVTSVLALAATFLLAFGLGWALHVPRSAMENVPSSRELASGPEHSTAPATHGDPEAATDTVAGAQSAASPIRAVGVLTWSVDDNGEERTVVMPVVEGPGIDEEWLRRQPSVVPASLRRTLESRGHHVEEHRELINLSLEDGRQLLVPVDKVEVRFANRVYQ